VISVTIYHTGASKDLKQLEKDLFSLQDSIPHHLIKIDLQKEEGLKENLAVEGLSLEIGPYHLHSPISKQELTVALSAAQDRSRQLEEVGDPVFIKKTRRGMTISRTDRVSTWLTQHYMLLFNVLAALYVGLPFLAPVLMKTGAVAPAKVIYTIYSPLCHQLGFRSWFLFGQQAYYPRQLAHIPNVETYEQITGKQNLDIIAARQFLGNEQVGYKVALCQRDVAIYGAILLFGLVFSLLKNRFKNAPWYIWVILGLMPIGIDGGSQLPALLANLPAWLPNRESNPFLRTLTGILFGGMTAWYIYPLIEESMKDTRKILLRKFALIDQKSMEGR